MKKNPKLRSVLLVVRLVVALILCSVGGAVALVALAGAAVPGRTTATAPLAQTIKNPIATLRQFIASSSVPDPSKSRFARLAPGGNSQSRSTGALSSATAQAPETFGPITRMSVANATTQALRNLPLASLVPQVARNEKEHPPIRASRPVPQGWVDPVVQATQGLAAAPAPLVTFEGQNVDDGCGGCIPPDITGAAGPTQYVQMVNSSAVSVYNKTGTRIAGPIQFNTMFGALPAGNQCRVNNDGDPIVLYDQLADRWLLSQFAVPGGANGYHECIAISQTGDASGAYYVYDFLIGDSTHFQDYPHFGLWPDAYYMSTHQFNPNSYNGAGVFAFERDKMLLGQPARFVYFNLGLVNLAFGGHLPADLDGFTLPPAGAPNYFVEVDDNSEIAGPGGSDAMRIWKFHVDWTNTANSTFGINGQPNSVVPVANFTRPNCIIDVAGCVPQPASPYQLDTLSDRLMYRLAYRNFGDHESLVVNHTVTANAATMQTGPRWYEVRDPGGSPTIYQQGTLAPTGSTDPLYRWMSSIAMDHMGNIAIGYSTSSEADFPSMAYAGRLTTDPLGQLSQGETQMWAGGGSENPFLFIGIGLGRWGDYSHLSVDPTDDCTFWYTNEYFPTPVDAFTAWHTRIGSFKFPQCVSVATPLSAVSRKTHGSAGAFDIPLPFTGNPGIECRTGGQNGDHDIVFTFAAPVAVGTATCAGNVAATSSVGNEIIVHCAGITNAQTVNITLNGASVPMAVLLGDTNVDGSVNSADIAQTKSQSGQSVNGSNFREDVNTDGSLNSADIALVKSKSGTALP